jgi:hypothetical protein
MRWLVTFTTVALVVLTPARAADLSDKEIQAARKLYNAKCAKCHKFYDPANYSAEDWNMWMMKMSKKAKLKPAQTELLTRYLDTFRVAKTNRTTQTP